MGGHQRRSRYGATPRPLEETSDTPGGWGTLELSVPVEMVSSQGTVYPGRVKATLTPLGKPDIKPTLLERVDRGVLRPEVARWLAGKPERGAELPVHPLELQEGLALLRLWYPAMHHALMNTTPMGKYTHGEYGARLRPPASLTAIGLRVYYARRHLRGWLEG